MNILFYENMNKRKISKATINGQITLPAEWRRKCNTDYFSIEMHDGYVKIRPFVQNEVLFDADRDNDGEGIPVDEMLSLLKKIDG